MDEEFPSQEMSGSTETTSQTDTNNNYNQVCVFTWYIELQHKGFHICKTHSATIRTRNRQ